MTERLKDPEFKRHFDEEMARISSGSMRMDSKMKTKTYPNYNIYTKGGDVTYRVIAEDILDAINTFQSKYPNLVVDYVTTIEDIVVISDRIICK